MKIQEIAKKANVSTATVSRVFSNHPNIREELRERVLAAPLVVESAGRDFRIVGSDGTQIPVHEDVSGAVFLR